MHITNTKAIALGVTGGLLIYASSPRVEALDDFNLASYGEHAYVRTARTEVILKLVPYTSTAVLNKEFDKSSSMQDKGHNIRGFTFSSPKDDVCYVHVIPARKWDDIEAMAIMGHEVYHCLLADHEG